MNAKRRSLLEIHTAVLLFGLAGLFAKWVAQPAIVIVFGRVFFATLFLAILLASKKESIRLKQRRDYFYLALMGVVLAIHWVTFFQAIQLSTVAIGLLTFSTFPVFVTFMEPTFFNEKIRRTDIIVTLVTFLGVALVIPSLQLGNNMTQGVIFGVISGFTFAILSILNRKYVVDYSSRVIAFYQDATAVFLLLPFLFILQPTFTLPDILLLGLLGVLFTGVAHTLFIGGLAHVKAQTASIIASLEPVYGIITAALFLGEIPTLRVILGGLIILGATFYATKKAKTETFV